MNISLYPVLCYVLQKQFKTNMSHYVTPRDIQSMVRCSEDASLEFFHQLVCDRILLVVPDGFLLSPKKSAKLSFEMKYIARQYLKEYTQSKTAVIRHKRQMKKEVIIILRDNQNVLV